MSVGEKFGFFLVQDPNTTALPLPIVASDRLAIVRGAATAEQTYYVSPTDIATATTFPVLVVTPASGDTVAMPDGTRSLYINTGALADLTILLPPVAGGTYTVEICPAAPVTALTIQDAAAILVPGAPTSGYGPGAAIVMKFIDTVGWRYWK
jgi:hypothetical protein